jgi:anti-sigma factor RsiW
MSRSPPPAPGAHPQDDELAGYALGALDPSQTEAVERHLDGCERCRSTVLWLNPAVDALGASVEQLEPPASLRENLLATVREEARDAEPAAKPWWRGGRVSFRARPALALGLAALAIAGVIGYGINAADEGTSTIPAEGTTAATAASGVVERGGDSTVLSVERMPALGRGEVYQAWVRTGADLEPLGRAFKLRADGTAEAVLPTLSDDADEILVTREPSRHAVEPSSEPLLSARLD